MAYSEEQRALRTAAERFAREKLAPRYQTREQEGRIDRALLREMGALGLIAGDLAESHGGLGLSSETTGLIMEALAYGDVNVAYVQLLGSLCGQIIARHATEDIAATWLPRIVSGESLVALALTEPRGGSDAANLALWHGRSTPVMCSTARNPRSALPTRPMPFWSLLALGASRTAPTASAPFSCP